MAGVALSHLAFAASGGVVTFFAPCAYPLLPGYVACFLGVDEGEDGGPGLRRAAAVDGLVSAGFFVVYAALVGVVVAVGAQALAGVSLLEPVVGVALIVLGVAMATGATVAPASHLPLPERRRSAAGFVLFGIAYAAAAAGCTGPVFVAIALTGLSAGPVGALATLVAYAGGMAVLMVGVSVLAAFGRTTVLRWLSARGPLLSRLAGVVLVLAGVVQVYYFVVVFDGLRTLPV